MSRVENRLCWVLAAEIHVAVLLLTFILCRPEQDEDAKTAPPPASAAARPAPTAPGRVHWFDSLDDARAAARREGKLVFYYQLVGDIAGPC